MKKHFVKNLINKGFSRFLIIFFVLIISFLLLNNYLLIVKKNNLPDSKGEVNIYFCSIINCTEIIFNEINDSEKIDCAFYNINNKALISLLEKKKAGLIIDEDGLDKINSSIAFVRKGKGLMHNKFCILDNNKTITGSYNPVDEAKNDFNNLIIISSKPIANKYSKIFFRIKNTLLSRKKFYDNYESDEDDNNLFIHNNRLVEVYDCFVNDCSEKIISIINSADKEIDFALFTFTDHNIAEAIINKSKEGVLVKGVIESYQQRRLNQYYYLSDDLRNKVFLEKSPRLQHNKFFIIDNNTLITGSYNPTISADSVNDENLIIFHDERIAMVYADYFNNYLLKQVLNYDLKNKKV